jgi:Flp pilus assembly protein TadG
MDSGKQDWELEKPLRLWQFIIRPLRNSRGQALVEFALVIPIFLLLVLGMMDVGIVLNQYLVVTEAAREGVRSAALGSSDTISIAVAKSAAATIDQGNLQVSVLPTVKIRGASVTVTVSNPVKIVTPLISAFFPANFQVQGVAVMRVE